MAFTAEQGLKKRKSRKPRNSKDVLAKYFGLEPKAKNYNDADTDYSKDLNWYSEVCSRKEGFEWLLEYLKTQNRLSDIALVKNVTRDDYIPRIVCWQARMMTNGSILDKASIDFFDSKIAELANYQKKKKVSEGPKVSPIDRVKRKNAQIIQEYEAIEDDVLWPSKWTAEFSLYNFIVSKGPNQLLLNWFKDFFTNWAEEMTDEDFHSTRSKKDRLNMEKFVAACLADLENLMRNKKVERKTRKPKSIPAAKMAAGLDYLDKYDPMQLVSITPESVMGKTTLWAFNIRYNTMIVYKALDGGFSAKGKSLTNVDLEGSEFKRLRKPQEMLTEFMNSSLPVQRKWMSSVKAKGNQPKGRLSKETILLKAV